MNPRRIILLLGGLLAGVFVNVAIFHPATAGLLIIGACVPIGLMLTYAATKHSAVERAAWHLTFAALDLSIAIVALRLGWGLEVKSWIWLLAVGIGGRTLFGLLADVLAARRRPTAAAVTNEAGQ